MTSVELCHERTTVLTSAPSARCSVLLHALWTGLPVPRLVLQRRGSARAPAAQAGAQGARLQQALHIGPVALLPRARPPALVMLHRRSSRPMGV